MTVNKTPPTSRLIAAFGRNQNLPGEGCVAIYYLRYTPYYYQIILVKIYKFNYQPPLQVHQLDGAFQHLFIVRCSGSLDYSRLVYSRPTQRQTFSSKNFFLITKLQTEAVRV